MTRHWLLLLSTLLLAGGFASGHSALDETQRVWLFQPSELAWEGRPARPEGMQDVWIEFESRVSGEPVHLHGLWLEPARPRAGQPLLLFLHGVRWNVAGSAQGMRRMQEMGFAVLAIDYRGFGQSTRALPSEEMTYEDARAAWEWLGRTYPGRPRYIYGHSLGGAVAIDLAAQVPDEHGTIVESTFTSIPDLARSFNWGWLPVGPLITQRFDSIHKIRRIDSPLLVVHGSHDRMVAAEYGRRLYDAAHGPKKFLLIEGGSHHSAMEVGLKQYREAIEQLFEKR